MKFKPYEMQARGLALIEGVKAVHARLVARRSELTPEGLAAEWERLASPLATKATVLRAEVESMAYAVEKVEQYYRRRSLPEAKPVPDAATAATVARVLDRPGDGLVHAQSVLSEFIGTEAGTVILAELVHRGRVTEEQITAALLDHSEEYRAALVAQKALAEARANVLMKIARQAEHAAKSFDAAGVHAHTKYLVDLAVVLAPAFGEEQKITLMDNGGIMQGSKASLNLIPVEES